MLKKIKSKISSIHSLGVAPGSGSAPAVASTSASTPSNLRTVCTEAEAAAAATRFEIAANKIDQAAIKIDGAAEKITDIANKFDNYFLPSIPEHQEQQSYPSLTPENLKGLQIPSRNLARTESISSIPSSQLSEEYRNLGLEPDGVSETKTNYSIPQSLTSEEVISPSSNRLFKFNVQELAEELQKLNLNPSKSSSRPGSLSSEQLAEELRNVNLKPSESSSRPGSLSFDQLAEELRNVNLKPSESSVEDLRNQLSSSVSSVPGLQEEEHLQLPSPSSSRTSSGTEEIVSEPSASEQNLPGEPLDINPQISGVSSGEEGPDLGPPPSFLPPPPPQQEAQQEAQPKNRTPPSIPLPAIPKGSLSFTQKEAQKQQVKIWAQNNFAQDLSKGEDKTHIDTINNEIIKTMNYYTTKENLPFSFFLSHPISIRNYIQFTKPGPSDNYFLFISKTSEPPFYVVGKNMEYFIPSEFLGAEYSNNPYKNAIKFISMFGNVEYASISSLQKNFYFLFPIITTTKQSEDEKKFSQDLSFVFKNYYNLYNIFQASIENSSYMKYFHDFILNFMSMARAYISNVFAGFISLDGNPFFYPRADYLKKMKEVTMMSSTRTQYYIITKDEITRKVLNSERIVNQIGQKAQSVLKQRTTFDQLYNEFNAFKEQQKGGRRTRPKTRRNIKRRTTRRVKGRVKRTKRRRVKGRVSKRGTKKYIKRRVPRRTKRNLKRETKRNLKRRK